MTARLLVLALALVALATQPFAYDLLALKRSILLAAASALLLLPPMQRAFVRTIGGAARRVVVVAGGFALAAACALATQAPGSGERVIVLRGLLELLLAILAGLLVREVAWERGETLLRGIVALGGVLGAVAVGQALGLDPVYGPRTAPVPEATFGNSAAFAAFAAPCFAVAAARAGRPRALLAALATALLAAALVLARSRGAWLAAAAGLAAALLLLRRAAIPRARARAAGAAALGVAAGLAIALAAAPGSEAAARPLGLGLERSSNRVRLDVARSTLALVAERPLLGCGPGRFRDEYPRVRREREARIGTREGAASEVDHPHNEPLRLLAEGGALTGVLAMLALAGLAAVLARAPRATRGDDGSSRAALAAGGVAWLAASLTWSTLYDPACALLGALLAGGVLACEDEVSSSRPRELPFARLFAAAVAAASLWLALPTLRAELSDWRAARDGALDRGDLDALARAAALDRFNVDRQYSIGVQFLRAARGDAGAADHHLARARECLQRALDLVPAHVASWQALAEAAARAGDDETARAAIARLHALEPWRGGVEAGLAELLASAGRELAAARARLDAEGDSAVAPLLAQARALRGARRGRLAAQILDLIAPRAPEDGDLWRELALALQELGDDAGRRRAFRQSQIAYAVTALGEMQSEKARENLAVARRFAPAEPGSTAIEELLEACVDMQRARPDAARARLEALDPAAALGAAQIAPPTAARFLRMLAAQPALKLEIERLGLDRL